MGKRSSGTFERRERDFYPTPLAPAVRLRPWLSPDGRAFRFAEPCVGAGDLRRHLETIGGICTWASDITDGVDAQTLPDAAAFGADYIVTNPPWPKPRDASETLAIIRRCMSLRMSWFLLSADFAHNKYFGGIEDNCRRIVSVGRVRWIPDSKHDGVDNAAWYLFSERHNGGPRFHNAEVTE